MSARERRAVRMFIRRDTYGRYVSVPRLPAPRPLQHRRSASGSRGSCRTGSTASPPSSPSGSTSPRPRACTSSSTCPRASQIPDVDTADLERRLTEASRSWRDDFATAVIAEYGEEVGTRLGRRYADSFPEAYKEDFSARTAAVDLGRLEAIRPRATRAAGRPRRSTSSSTPAAARPGSRSTGSAPPLSLSEVLPMLSSMGVEVVDERPYELEGLERHVATSTSSGCATADRCPAGSRELFQDALRAVWDGDNEIDGFNGAGARRRADLAAGDGAARLREVHAPGQHARSRRTTSRTRCAQRRHHPAAGRSCSRPASTRASSDVPADARPDARVEESRTASPRARRRGQPRPRPDPALLPDPHQGDAAHQLLPARPTTGGAARLHVVQARAVGDPRPAGAAAAVRDLRLLAAGRGRPPALRRRSPAVACAGPTDATTSAPRCSAWSRRRW